MFNKEEVQNILQEAGVRFKSSSRSFILTCPQCSKSEKLYIRKSDGRFICFYCKEINNFSGKCEFALSALTKLSINEVKKRLYGDFFDTFNSPYIEVNLNPRDFLDDDEIEIGSEIVLPIVSFSPDIIDIADSKAGTEYLESRGISLLLAKKYKLKYDVSGKRVVFPISYRNELYGWQGRYIGKEEYWDEETETVVKIPKAITTGGLKKDKVLMFRDNLLGSEHCVLCEGPIDGLKADLCGGNVVTLGKIVSKFQLDLIRKSGVKKIYLALDPDAAKECRGIIQSMGDLELYDMRPTQASDIGKMSLESVKELFDSAQKVDSSKIFVYIRNPFEVE